MANDTGNYEDGYTLDLGNEEDDRSLNLGNEANDRVLSLGNQLNGRMLALANEVNGRLVSLGSRAGDLVDSPAGTLWTPAKLTSEIWIDPSDATTVTVSGSEIQQIDDKSGNDRHATLSDASGSDVLQGSINGLDSVQMDIGGAHLQTSPLSGSTEYSVFFVAKPEADTTYIVASLTSTRYVGTAQDGAGTAPQNAVATAPTYYANGQVITSTRDALHDEWAGGTVGAFVGLIGDSAWTAAWNWFYYTSSTFRYSGEYGEIIVVAGTPNTQTRQRIEGYLAHKWGYEAKLDVSHPHKSSPPRLESAGPDFAGFQRYEWAADFVDVSDASPVSLVEELGGSGIDLVQTGITANMPVFRADVGGDPALDFRSGDDFLEATDLNLDWTDGYTLFFLYQPQRYNIYGGLITLDSGFGAVSDDDLEVYWNSSTNGGTNVVAIRRNGGTAYQQTGDHPLKFGQEHILTIGADATSPTLGYIRVDEDLTDVGGSGTNILPPVSTFSRIQVGRGYNQNEPYIYLRAVLAYDGLLSDSQVQEVWANLRTRFPNTYGETLVEAPSVSGANKYEWAADRYNMRDGDFVRGLFDPASGVSMDGSTSPASWVEDSGGGVPAIRFGEDPHVYQKTGTGETIDQTSGYTIITYMKPTNTDIQEWMYMKDSSGSNAHVELRIHSAGSPYNIRLYDRTSASTALSNSVFTRDKEIVSITVSSGGAAKIYRGATDVTSGSPTVALPASPTEIWTVGHALFSGVDFVGDMYAVVMYDKELSPAEIATVVSNLESRFGAAAA